MQPIVSGSVYAIRAYNEVLVKRLNRHIDGNIEAASDNPRFKLHIIKAEAARHLWVDGESAVEGHRKSYLVNGLTDMARKKYVASIQIMGRILYKTGSL